MISSSTTNLIQDTLLMHVNCQIRPELTAIEGAGPNNWIALQIIEAQIIGIQIIASLAALEAALGVILMYHSVSMSGSSSSYICYVWQEVAIFTLL